MEQFDPEYIFGPVPSHRLGRSLGIDPFGGPTHKSCTMDCIFCEVGSTRFRTFEPVRGPNPDELVQSVLSFLGTGLFPDYITVSGSGEPTLWLGLGRFLSSLHQKIEIPLAVITNSSMLGQITVREMLMPANVVLPTLTTTDEKIFALLHAPLPGVTAHSIIQGIRLLRKECSSQIWLEVFLISGINDGEDSLRKLAKAIVSIEPHKVQITTLSRPGRQEKLKPVLQSVMEKARDILAESGVPTEIVVSCVRKTAMSILNPEQVKKLRAMLRLRWVSLSDLAASMGMEIPALEEELSRLWQNETLTRKEKDGIVFLRLE